MKKICLITSVFLLSFINILLASITEIDSFKVLGIRVEFQLDEETTTTGNGKFDLSVNTDPNKVDPPPHNRLYFEDHFTFLHNYYWKVSRGKLAVNGDVFPQTENEAYQLDHSMSYYNSNTTQTEINEGLAKLVRDAIQKADADAGIDFSAYQSVIIFHAGVGKDIALGFDETPQDIPSFFVNSEFLQTNLGQPSIVVDNNIEIKSAILLPETESQEGLELGLNGVLVSNFASQLGWLDLFNPETRRPGIGRFGLMDAGLFNGDGVLPSVPCAWTRINAGWENPVDINYASNDEFTIYHTASGNDNRVYRIPINRKEYFLVENRFSSKKTIDEYRFEMSQNRSDYPSIREVLNTHFADEVTFSPRGVLIDAKNMDLGLSGNGCLIWHIDENIIDAKRAVNRVNDDANHRGVDLEEADGSQDIGYEFEFLSAGSGSENGWILDMWYPDNDAPLFKEDDNTFAANTTPNSRSYYNRANSHIKISGFSEADSVMTFRVNLNIFQNSFPRQIETTVVGVPKMIKTTDLDGDKKNDLVISTDQGKIFAIHNNPETLWSGGSSMLADLGTEIIHPAVFIDDERATATAIDTKRMIALTEAGIVYGFSFTAAHTVDTLFSPIDCGEKITTSPIAVEGDSDLVEIYWGTELGKVYKLSVVGSELPFDTTSYSIGEPVKFLHLDDQKNIIAVAENGNVHIDDRPVFQNTVAQFRPSGNSALSVNSSGEFELYSEDNLPEQSDRGLFSYQSAPVNFDYLENGELYTRYFSTASNKLLSYNYNFAISENFPLEIYAPDQSTDFSLSALIGKFQTAKMTDDFGAVVVDPSGLIDGFDFSGKRLSQFPLSAGDSLACAPLLCDLDGDGDVEVIAVTKSGGIYAWDLEGEFDEKLWHQSFADAYNSNRILRPVENLPTGGSIIKNYDGLMPEDKVYNWPNPNIDDYTFIRYYLTANADVTIKIFDLAGDLVLETDAPGMQNTDNEFRWNLSNVQSGVYLAHIKAESGSESDYKLIKIAVIK